MNFFEMLELVYEHLQNVFVPLSLGSPLISRLHVHVQQ